MPAFAHRILGRFRQVGQPAVGEALALEHPEFDRVEVLERTLLDRQLEVDQFLDLRQEPGIDPGQSMHFFERHTDAERIGHEPQPLGPGIRQFVRDGLGIDRLQVEAVDADL